MKALCLITLLLFAVPSIASDDDESPNINANLNANLNGNLNKNSAKSTATGIGISSATGGNVDSRISNRVSNKQGQKQGQLQGQLQGQKQSANNKQGQSANNKQGQSNKITIQDNSVYEAQKRNPVSSALAPNLVTGGDDICLGSSSAGAQGVGFGVSFGTTTQDENCVMIKQTKLLSSMGLKNSAIARMCANTDMALAMKADGHCGEPAVGGGSDDGLPLMSEITYDADGDAWLGSEMQ